MVTTSKNPTPAAGEAAAASTTMTNLNMTDTSLTSIVPSCPQGLCITKSDFLKPDFTVDNFFIEASLVRNTILKKNYFIMTSPFLFFLT